MYAVAFPARYLIRFAAALTSSVSLMYMRELGAGAKSKIFGGPVTIGTEPAHVNEIRRSGVSTADFTRAKGNDPCSAGYGQFPENTTSNNREAYQKQGPGRTSP